MSSYFIVSLKTRWITNIAVLDPKLNNWVHIPPPLYPPSMGDSFELQSPISIHTYQISSL